MQTDYAADFPTLPHLSNYNRRCKHLAGTTEHFLARLWGGQLCPHEDTFMVDSVPIPVACITREYPLPCVENSFIPPRTKTIVWSWGDILLAINSMWSLAFDGIYHSMELTKASVHDVHYLKELRHSGLQDCLVLVDKG